MIDFRYHLVSLISVFLALAVGIALGAGPLEETIGDTLTGQVDQLRVEREELRTQLQQSEAEQQDLEAFAAATGPQLLEGALAGRRVALVQLGESSPERVAAVDAALAAAGATTSARVTLTDAWTDPEQRPYRTALVGNLVEYLDPAPAEDAGTAAELAAALVQGLVRGDAANPDALGQDASLLLELLSTGDNALVTLQDPVTAPADAVVVLQPLQTDDAGNVTDPVATPTTDSTEAAVALLRAGGTYAEGAVLADGPETGDTLTTAVLADADLAAELTTVTGTQGVVGQTVLPLALAADIAGTVGHYGTGDGETVLPPSVTLPAPDRTPTSVPEQPTDGADAGTGEG
ncbi:copper transporter [Cellulomonas marina]|uniref:Copper transport outer membrane protein, MctB n=1 Tax=Cellulomonas marina TaxID=988821 RepID=A0A1I0ZSN7_9CELL|nr:copper transporter [Cellulomonas marina]GIG28779.1 hypothetical protein Cma02nite_13790 [Cellulomonas marina]SFB28754.1 Copper transport outer membrane protein, MctB [Cellulomonas marina]